MIYEGHYKKLVKYRYKSGEQKTYFGGPKCATNMFLLAHTKYRNPFMGIV